MKLLRFRPAALLVGLMFALSLLLPAGTTSASEPNAAAESAVEWLISQQQHDGGFPGFDGESDPGATADAIVALAAAGIDVREPASTGASPVEYLKSVAPEYTETQAGAAKMMVAVVAAGGNPRDVARIDLVDLVQSHAGEASGAYHEQVFIHSIAMLALLGAGEETIDGAVEFLLDRQIEDGSWAFTGETEPGMGDTNTTSLAMQALAAVGQGGDAIENGLGYLNDAQLDDGSFVYAIGIEDPPMGDSNSTALAIQALLSAGVEADDPQLAHAHEALVTFQNESGAFGYREDMPDDNLLSTAQALPALLNQPLPITPPASPEDPLRSRLLDAIETSDPLDPDACDYFEITGHNLCHGFRDYWRANGQLAIFGYPMTEEFDMTDENGELITAQYFERARFEYRPDAAESQQVTVAALGYERFGEFELTEIFDPVGPCKTPADAEHAICGVFLAYWDDFGGKAVFGSPISETFDSSGMTVQLFEYARFEHQPGEWPERHDVLLGRIGAEALRERRE